MHDSPAPRPQTVPIRTWFVLALLLLLIFAIQFDQGQLLQPLMGRAAVSANYLHELFHDGRHLLAVPCH